MGGMKRFLTVLAATAVAAAVTIPALADDPGDGDAKFVTCLRSQGLDIPADTHGDAVKTWLLAHQSDAAVDPALRACKTREEGPSPKAEELSACLRAHGL